MRQPITKRHAPRRGHVWFEEGTRVPATIHGVLNNSAVADVAVADALKILREAGVTATKTPSSIVTETENGTDILPIKNGRAHFNGSWTLYHDFARTRRTFTTH